jgi:regulatory protein
MSIVTDIKQQKRRGTRYSVYLDDKYGFALSDLELSTSGLRVGQELTAEEAQHYQSEAERARVYASAIRFLGLRPRSRREMSDYLGRKGYPVETVGPVMERLGWAGLLDDREFAASWIASRQALRPRSRRMLAQELAAKGIARDEIEAALAELDGDSELDMLVEVVRKKQRLPQYQIPQKLMEYLARQGYSYELIKKALKRLGDG